MPSHDKSNLSFATRCIHGGQYPDPLTGAVMVPIYATSTYAQESPGVNKGYEYAREHNPTRQALERALANLDGGIAAYAFASGLAAMATLLDTLPAGSHIIASDDLYGGSHRMLDRVRKTSSGIEASFVDMSNVANVKAALRPNTRMLWIETPTNPFLKLADIAALATFARSHKLISVVDNTFATPWAQRPLEYGADVVLYSLTKYMNGHSDMLGGAIVIGQNQEYAEQIAFLQKAIGSILSPFDCFLALRGLKTLDLRMERHSQSAMKIATWLEKHPKIARVYYPGSPNHPQHELAKKQMRGFGGIISADIKGGLESAKRMLESCRLFVIAESLGAVESLIEHPAIMTHASIPADVRKARGFDDGFVRLSVGIEDVNDLIADLDQALGVA
jgi:cystathionine gamma-lyase